MYTWFIWTDYFLSSLLSASLTEVNFDSSGVRDIGLVRFVQEAETAFHSSFTAHVMSVLHPLWRVSDDSTTNHRPTTSTSLRRPHGHIVTWWVCCRFCFDINQPSLPTPFYSVLVSISVFMSFSFVFHSINSPDKSPLSHSVLPVIFLPRYSFQLYIFSWKSPSALV